MGTALLVLAAVLFIAAVFVFIAALRRPKHPSSGRQDPLAFTAAAPQFGPRQLGPSAIVSYGGIDYVVRGSVTYREGPFVWWEHLLEGRRDQMLGDEGPADRRHQWVAIHVKGVRQDRRQAV